MLNAAHGAGNGDAPGPIRRLSMRLSRNLISVLALCYVASCDAGTSVTGTVGGPAVRVVNGFTAPVDVLIDGQVVISALAAGSVSTALASAGTHTLVLRPTGSATSMSQSITAATGALRTIAVVRSVSGGMGSAT